MFILFLFCFQLLQCTSIEQKIKSSDSDSNSNETDHPITLSKTYDEVNIHVNFEIEMKKKSFLLRYCDRRYHINVETIKNSNKNFNN